VQLLLWAHADPNALDDDQCSPLHFARLSKATAFEHCATLLLQHNCVGPGQGSPRKQPQKPTRDRSETTWERPFAEDGHEEDVADAGDVNGSGAAVAVDSAFADDPIAEDEGTGGEARHQGGVHETLEVGATSGGSGGGSDRGATRAPNWTVAGFGVPDVEMVGISGGGGSAGDGDVGSANASSRRGTAQAAPASLATDVVKERVKNLLRRDNLKLWLPPYTSAATGQSTVPPQTIADIAKRVGSVPAVVAGVVERFRAKSIARKIPDVKHKAIVPTPKSPRGTPRGSPKAAHVLKKAVAPQSSSAVEPDPQPVVRKGSEFGMIADQLLSAGSAGKPTNPFSSHSLVVSEPDETDAASSA
jgi:hypothetical protein